MGADAALGSRRFGAVACVALDVRRGRRRARRMAPSGALSGDAVILISAEKIHAGETEMDAQLEGFLNTLGEAERAGGRVLHELTAEARSLELRELLKKAGHDEGYYAGELSAHVRRLGGVPSTKTGDFVEKVRAVDGFRGKLELLNRGQRWVIRKIEENLATIATRAAARSSGDGQGPLHEYRRARRCAERRIALSSAGRRDRVKRARESFPLITLAALAIARASASAETLGPGSHRIDMQYGGLGRSYIIHVPPQASSAIALPVILNFHGAGSNAEQEERYSGMDATADRDGFVAVYPNGTGAEQSIYLECWRMLPSSGAQQDR